MGSETERHRGGARREALRQSQTTTGSRLVQFLTQGVMRSDEMVIQAPPLQMKVEFARELGGAPGAAGERGETAAQSEIQAFDESGLDTTRESEGL